MNDEKNYAISILIIYDLGDSHNLKLIQFATTNKSDAFGYQVWVSNSGTDRADFLKVLPVTDDILLTATNTTDFNQYQLDTEARYVKLIGFGRFNSAGNYRESQWSAVGEIEFYRASSLSLNDALILENEINLYPNPVKNIFHITNLNTSIKQVQLFSLDDRKLLEKNIEEATKELNINLSSLVNGMYLVHFKSNKSVISRVIVVSN